MKTSRLILIAALASGLASVGSNGSGGIEQRATGAASPVPAAPAAVRFRQDGVCPVPVLTRAMPFKGGATTGEEVTVRLDTARRAYEIRIDASATPGRQGLRRRGTLTLDRQDCSYRLSGEKAVRLAVSKDGILFGGIDPGTPDQESPALIVAFKNTSRDIVDLSGNWWVFESRSAAEAEKSQDRRSGTAYEARILPDGEFSNCELQESANGRCAARVGHIHFNGTVFVSQEEDGKRATLVVGRAGEKLVPILLQQGSPGSGMRFLAPHKTRATPSVSGSRIPLPLRH